MDSKEVFGGWSSLVSVLEFFFTVGGVVLVVVVVVDVEVLVVLELELDARVVDVFFGLGENLLTGDRVVLLKSIESIVEGVNSGLLGIIGRRVVDGFWVEGL